MASIIAAETSAATFLGAPGEGYEKRSLAYVQLVLGLIIGRFIVGFVFLKPYYNYGSMGFCVARTVKTRQLRHPEGICF